MRVLGRMLLVPGLLAWPAAMADAQKITGTWSGTAPLPGQGLTLRLDIASKDSGIAAVIDIPESRLIGFPAPGASFQDGFLRIGVPPGWGLALFRDIGMAPADQVLGFAGQLSGDSITGRLTMAYATLPLVLHREAAPLPRDGRVLAEDVTFPNGDVTLAGTLYRPAGSHRTGAIVFTHGSGDQTRDAWRREAAQLAAAGVAALVYDKRGAGRSTGANWRVATFAELASDARAAVSWLARRPDIDSLRIGLFGLSQGTWLIGIVADQWPRVAFLVFASGSGIPVWEQDLYRTVAMMRAAGYSDSEIHQAEAYQRMKFEVARTGLGWALLDSTTQRLRAATRWFSDFGNEFASLSSARFWWLAAFQHDPTPILERIRAPVLGLFGEKDLSFPIAVVRDRMEQALARAGNCDVTLRVFPDAEHQLMVPQAYEGRTLRRVITPEFLTTLTAWVVERASRNTPRCPEGRGLGDTIP